MNLLFLYILFYYFSITSMESTNKKMIDTEMHLFNYCLLHNITYNVYDNPLHLYKEAYDHYDKLKTSENEKADILENTHQMWQKNRSIDLTYVYRLLNRIYPDHHNIVHNAQSQTIDPRTFEINDDKNFYSHDPLENGIKKSNGNSLTPIAFSYNAFRVTDSPEIFHFKDIFDGPNKNNIWIFGYHWKTEENNESLIKIVRINETTINNNILISKNFRGKITTLVSDESLNKVYVGVKIKKNTFLLYNMTFSMKHKEIFFNKYFIPDIFSMKKLLKLSSNLLLALTKKGELFKINIDLYKFSCINIRDYLGEPIMLHDIIKNNKLPYLWLLVSKTYELYFLNFKDKKEKITFNKIANVPHAKKIWFDGDHILVKHTGVDPEFSIPIESCTPIQYSLYKLYTILSTASVLRLCKDSNSAK